MKAKTPTREQAIAKLWEAGKLSWKLKGNQSLIYKHFTETEDDIATCLISRQYGKSFTLCLIAIEVCLSKPNAIVKYVCPTSKMVVNVIVPRIRDVIADCPEHLKPHWYPSEKKWKFPNGSEIQVAGTDNGAYDSIRGGSSDLCIADEAGFMTDLETVIFSVLAPTTDTTEGKIFLASTPNDKNPNHDFHEFFIFPLEASGKLLKLDYTTSPMVDEKQRARIIARYPGGINNIKFRCEYLCEIPNVSESSVIPEFSAVEDEIVKEVPVPNYCDFYSSMDLGFKDLTVVLFGYYDYDNARLVISDEYVINGPELKTDILDRNIKHKEKLRFRTSIGDQPAYMRISDNNNLMLLNELGREYGLTFVPTAKHNKDQAVDMVRRWIENKKIIIHPRCKNLIYHIKHAQWHLTRSGTFTGKFKNIKGNETAGLLTSHADALDALIYLVRNIHTYKNPYPNGYHENINENTHISRKYRKEESKGKKFMRKLFNMKD